MRSYFGCGDLNALKICACSRFRREIPDDIMGNNNLMKYRIMKGDVFKKLR